MRAARTQRCAGEALSQGLLGHMRFGAGKVDLAVGHYEQALRLCREQKDEEGIRVYLGHLYESRRYLGWNELAAGYAQELGQAWDAAGNAAQAKRFARLSQLVRAGEPLLRAVVHCDERVMELDEVQLQGTTKMQIHFWRNRPSLPGATKRIERGKELAGKRQFNEALELFREAAKCALTTRMPITRLEWCSVNNNCTRKRLKSGRCARRLLASLR